jgi:hypothetical protein
MKKALAWILVFVFAFSYFPATGNDTYQIEVVAIKGEVKRETSNPIFQFLGLTTWQNLSEGDLLQPGDKIKTGEGSLLELIFANGTYTHIGEKSRVVIGQNRQTEQGTSSTVRINQGRIWAKVKRAWREITKFKVITPSAVAGVKGTVFTVAVRDSTILSVKEGVVKFTERETKKNVLVRKNMMSTVSREKIEPPHKIDKDEKKLWKNKEIKSWLKKKKPNPGKSQGHNKRDEDQSKKAENNISKKDKSEGQDQPKDNQDNSESNNKSDDNAKNNSNKEAKMENRENSTRSNLSEEKDHEDSDDDDDNHDDEDHNDDDHNEKADIKDSN